MQANDLALVSVEAGDDEGGLATETVTDSVTEAVTTDGPTGGGDTDAEPLTADQEHLRIIAGKRAIVRNLELRYEMAKEDAKELRKSLEEANKELGRAIDRGPQFLPLFDGPQAPANQTQASANGKAEHDGRDPAQAPAPDAWKLADIEAVGLPPKIVEKLREAHINTVGDFEARRADSLNGAWFVGVAGIGRKKADDVENAVLDWLGRQQGASQVELRADEIGGSYELANDFRELSHPKAWMSGRDAANRGLKLDNCPYVPGAEQDDWIRGFLFTVETDEEEWQEEQDDDADDDEATDSED